MPPRSPPPKPKSQVEPEYKLTLYGSCPGCGQFAGKIEWSAPNVRALKLRSRRESLEGYCASCRRHFPLTWAQVRHRGRMIREGDLERVLNATESPDS